MKIKSFLLASVSLLMSVLLHTGCNCNSNATLKTKDDFTNSMKQCSQFAHDHHMNPDSAVKACFGPGNGCIQTGDPPVVVLNDTVYIYVGKGTDSIIKSSNDTIPIPLTTTGGTQLTQVQIKWTTGPITQLSHHSSYVGISSAQAMLGYDYRIAIPIPQYSNPRGNSFINLIGPSLPSNSSGGVSGK